MAQNHLFRSVKNRKIAGVAGGIGEYLEVDSAVVRLVWLLAVLFGGAGVLAYIIAWIVIPEEKTGVNDENFIKEKPISTGHKIELIGGINFFGILLVVLGVFFLLKEFIPFGLTRYFWPLIIIGLGIFLLIPRK